MSDWKNIKNEKKKYAAYLCSREWNVLKEAVRERAGGQCERCKALPMDAVHHLNYSRKYHEELSDLQAICNACHEFTHAKSEFDPEKFADWIRYISACRDTSIPMLPARDTRLSGTDHAAYVVSARADEYERIGAPSILVDEMRLAAELLRRSLSPAYRLWLSCKRPRRPVAADAKKCAEITGLKGEHTESAAVQDRTLVTQMVQHIGGMTAQHLERGWCKVDGDELLVTFPSNCASSASFCSLPAKSEEIVSAASKILGRALKLRVVTE